MIKIVVTTLRPSLNRNYSRCLEVLHSVCLSTNMYFDAFLLSHFSSKSAVFAIWPRVQIGIPSLSFTAWLPKEDVLIKRDVSAVFSLS